MPENQLKSKFLLNPDIIYLNFGSFGACPKPVFEDYQQWQRQLEFEPVQFMTVKGVQHLKESRDALGKFVGCEGDDLVFVTNPSYAVNIVAKNLQLKEGDEVLSTDLEYGACDRTWNYYCKKAKARYVRQHISLPVTSKEQIVEDLFKGCNERTRVIFISHLTSSTALILPVREIIARAKAMNIMTVVDGAHVPGHLPLNIADLDADVYTGACHKWMLAPKGCSFFYVRKELQKQFDPLVVSWGYESIAPTASQFQDYHQMQGTRDFSAFLTIPACVEFMEKNNWRQVATQSRKLVRENAERFCKLLGVKPLSPLDDDFLGQMFSIPIKPLSPERLQRYLYLTYNIEIPVMRHDDKVYLRYSINGFNNQSDLDALYVALKEIIEVTDFLEVGTLAG